MTKKLFPILILLFLFGGCSKEVNDQPVLDKKIFNSKNIQTKEFYFIGKWDKKFGIYKYNFDSKKTEIFWNRRNKNVIRLDYSPNQKNIYFITARYLGKRSTLPYIKKIKLYRLDVKKEKVEYLDTLVNGSQLNSKWLDNNSYKIVINSPDKKVSEYINQYSYMYNGSGKKIMSEIETFDFIKNGYPLPVIKRSQIPVNKNFQLIYGDSLYILDKIANEKHFIFSLKNLKIHNEYWSDDFLIFNTAPIANSNILLVYSIKRNQVIKMFSNNYIKNFIIFNDYLVYDYGLGFSSSISIFNLKKTEVTDSIKINGGCGLNSVL